MLMLMLLQRVLYFVALMGAWLLRILKKQLLMLYLSNMINRSVTSLFGLEKYLVYLHKNLKRNMVPNQVEVVVLQQLLTRVFPLNYGDNMVIGLLLKVKNVT